MRVADRLCVYGRFNGGRTYWHDRRSAARGLHDRPICFTRERLLHGGLVFGIARQNDPQSGRCCRVRGKSVPGGHHLLDLHDSLPCRDMLACFRCRTNERSETRATWRIGEGHCWLLEHGVIGKVTGQFTANGDFAGSSYGSPDPSESKVLKQFFNHSQYQLEKVACEPSARRIGLIPPYSLRLSSHRYPA